MRKYSEITETAITYINENLSAALSVEDISSNIFVSRSYMQKIFKEDTGISAGKYIEYRIMEKAKEYLDNDDMTINEISKRLGFCDRYYFGRRFSAVYGISPHKYRCGKSKSIIMLYDGNFKP